MIRKRNLDIARHNSVVTHGSQLAKQVTKRCENVGVTSDGWIVSLTQIRSQRIPNCSAVKHGVDDGPEIEVAFIIAKVVDNVVHSLTKDQIDLLMSQHQPCLAGINENVEVRLEQLGFDFADSEIQKRREAARRWNQVFEDMLNDQSMDKE